MFADDDAGSRAEASVPKTTVSRVTGFHSAITGLLPDLLSLIAMGNSESNTRKLTIINEFSDGSVKVSQKGV